MKKVVLLLMIAIAVFANTSIDEFKKLKAPYGITDEKGRTYYYGEAVVSVNPNDPTYVKEISLAYEKAMLTMQADFILQTYGKESVKKIYESFEDDSSNANEFPPIKEAEDMARKGKLAIIMDKFLDVVQNSLDKKLIEQGVSPDELKKLSIEQKKQLFKDNFTKITTKKAFQSMMGLVPRYVKIGQKGGATVVAVIAVQSPKTIQFAKDIAKKRVSNVKGKPRKLSDLLPKTAEEYTQEIGLRYTYDEKGRPMLLSYGLWSVTNKTKSASRRLKKINNAKRKARMQAESYIGDFIKTNIQAVEKSEQSSVYEEVAKKITTLGSGSKDTQEVQEEIKETIDKYFKTFKATSNFDLRGTNEVTNWDYKDKNGLLYVGSVVTWSYNQLENVNNYIEMTKNKPKKKVEQKATVIIEKQSRDINDDDDF